MSDSTLIKEMLDNAVHIWYKRQYWSPKMRDYIHGIQNGIHVFDLYKTCAKLEEVRAILANLAENGKEVLIVGTKVQARDLVKELAISTNHHFVIDKWVPGLLTNFSTLKRRIFTYNKLEKDAETGVLDMLTKKEKAMKMKELEKLKKAYEGLKELKKTPDAVFVIDGHYEGLALTEARILKIPSFALLGSTGDIDSCTNFIPCNVNSIKAIKFMLDQLKPTLTRKKIEKPFAAPEAARPPRNPNPIKRDRVPTA
ncbi:MAG: ribosomal protein S2 [uncultured bacterium (gcode 4)]|uniref:Small ribosomal subunit protein uS2 n=1 Tax=uncultured bacterium (gcode 4) TaxID=1234023 RepID=K2GDB3_9BACT|nr:MAG: ribosomal protein S2 [uncultured bacterium (gcode 4)]